MKTYLLLEWHNEETQLHEALDSVYAFDSMEKAVAAANERLATLVKDCSPEYLQMGKAVWKEVGNPEGFDFAEWGAFYHLEGGIEIREIEVL